MKRRGASRIGAGKREKGASRIGARKREKGAGTREARGCEGRKGGVHISRKINQWGLFSTPALQEVTLPMI